MVSIPNFPAVAGARDMRKNAKELLTCTKDIEPEDSLDVL
jgi:hypothetical protein